MNSENQNHFVDFIVFDGTFLTVILVKMRLITVGAGGFLFLTLGDKWWMDEPAPTIIIEKPFILKLFMSPIDLIPTITADYAKFPEAQTYSIYSPDVYFKDPMYDFRGLGQYQKMIGFITTWFKNLKLDLHEINEAGDGLKTRWTMSWDAPLPWKPRISISGWSTLTISPDNLITSHIDYWDCSRLDMIKQHFKF